MQRPYTATVLYSRNRPAAFAVGALLLPTCVGRDPAAPLGRPRLTTADTVRRDADALLAVRRVVHAGPMSLAVDSACPAPLRAIVTRCARRPETGHWYAVLPVKLYHVEAEFAAVTLPDVDGASPALATITSADEQAFVLTQVLANLVQPMPDDAPLDAHWLGATATGGDGSVRTGWAWRNGEPWNFAP